MEKMFSKKAWCNPVATASSTGLLKRNLDIESSTISSKLSSSNDDSLDDVENNSHGGSKLNLMFYVFFSIISTFTISCYIYRH